MARDASIVLQPGLTLFRGERRVTELSNDVVEIPPQVIVEHEPTNVLEESSLGGKFANRTNRFRKQVSCVGVSPAVTRDAERLARNAGREEARFPVER